MTVSQNKNKLDTILTSCGLETFHRLKMNSHDLVKKGEFILQKVLNTTSDAIEDSNNITLPRFSNLKLKANESSWFRSMILNLKSKFEDDSTSYNEKIGLLTVLPEDWSFKQIIQYFDCTWYMFKESQKLRESIGKKIFKYFIRVYLHLFFRCDKKI